MDKAGGVKAISDAVPAKAMFNDEDSDEEEPDNTMNAAQQHVAGAVNDGFTSLNNACLIVASDIGAESPMSKVSMVTEKVTATEQRLESGRECSGHLCRVGTSLNINISTTRRNQPGGLSQRLESGRECSGHLCRIGA